MPLDLSLFKHSYPMRVRSFHVDRQNVVHNIWYFFLLEEARVEYFRAAGLPIDEHTFVSNHKFYVVRNTCDYYSSATFDEEIDILTRTEYIRNTSMATEQLIVSKKTGKLIAAATHTIVYISVETDRPERIPDEIREGVRQYEGGTVRFETETPDDKGRIS